MTKTFRRVLVSAGALMLTGMLTFATSPVQASSVDQRIDTLEQELARLKKEQADTREQAIAAQKKLPLFIYRPGAGLTIAAANDKWEIQFGNRLMVYWTFWTKGSDGTSIPKNGTTNGVLTIRRFRPFINMRVNDGFYDLRFKLNVEGAGSTARAGLFNAFDAEMYIHFENISPWFPYLAFGASPSAILNPNDNNLSSSLGPRTEPGGSLAAANGVGTGSPDRGMGVVWRKIPRFGPVRVSFLNFWLGQDRIGTASQFASNSNARLTRDGRSFTGGIGVRPFDKWGGTLGKWLKGLELSIGTVIQKSPRSTSGFGAWNVRTSQTRAQRISMIRTDSSGTAGTMYYVTPGLQWKWKWIQFYAAGHFTTARLCNVDGNGRCNIGDLARMNGWQFIAAFWLWSPKNGLLAGNPREGGLMVSPLFGRSDVKQNGNSTLRSCGGCSSAYAVQSGIALWYYIPGRNMNVGLTWDHWSCNNCNSDVARVVPGFVAGDNAAWDTITLTTRFRF